MIFIPQDIRYVYFEYVLPKIANSKKINENSSTSPTQMYLYYSVNVGLFTWMVVYTYTVYIQHTYVHTYVQCIYMYIQYTYNNICTHNFVYNMVDNTYVYKIYTIDKYNYK